MISKYLQQILSARYGKDVRQSIHDGIKEIDGVARAAQNSATANAQTASAKASEALTASQEALKKAQEAQASAQQAKVYAENAEAVTGVNIGTKDRAGIVKGGENHIAEDGTLELVVKTTETKMPNSRKGRVEVVEIGGVCEQVTTTGKNILKVTASSTTQKGVTFTVNADGSIARKGTSTEGFSFYVTEPINLPVGEYFNSGGCVIYRRNASGEWLETIQDNQTFSVTDITQLFAIHLWQSASKAYNDTVFPMISKVGEGNTWEPYTGGSPAPSPNYPQEIKKSVVSGIKTHGKNIVKHNATNQVICGVTFKPNADGSISVSGTATDMATYMIRNYDIKDLKYGTSYILSGCPNGGSAATFALSINSGDYVQSVYEFGEGTTFSLQRESMTNFALFIRVVKGATVNATFYPMIREASVADGTYEPYTESSITFSQPIELNGKGDVQDVIEDGKTKRRFASVVLNGSEEWVVYATSQSGKYRNSYNGLKDIIKKPDGITTIANVLCSHYEATTSNSAGTYGCNQGVSVETSTGNLYFYDENYNTSNPASWKEWLAENPITVVYELAEEATEDLPLADQIALNSLATFDGATYIEFDSEVQPTFKGNYGTSLVGSAALESLLIARNNELRISALEA